MERNSVSTIGDNLLFSTPAYGGTSHNSPSNLDGSFRNTVVLELGVGSYCPSNILYFCIRHCMYATSISCSRTRVSHPLVGRGAGRGAEEAAAEAAASFVAASAPPDGGLWTYIFLYFKNV